MKEITEDKGRVRPVVEGDFQCDENGNSTRFYEILSIIGYVKDDGTKIGYISKTDVPIGIPITDTNYWYPFQVIAVPKGDKGNKGDNGKSAYELYIEHGGTIAPVEAWLASLQGKDGKDGTSPIIKISDNGMDILISSDNGETWYVLIPDFTKLRILGFVESISQLPKSADIGDIYGVWNAEAQGGSGVYELYINTVTDWALDANITKVYSYDVELPSVAQDGSVAIVPVKLVLDKEKVDAYKVYKYNSLSKGWVLILNTAEIYNIKEDIINHGDNLYALVQGSGLVTETKLKEETIVSKKDYCRITNMTDESLLLIITQDSKRMFHSIGTGTYMLPNNCGVFLVNNHDFTGVVIAKSISDPNPKELSELEYMPEGIYPYYILTESSASDIYITPASKLDPESSDIEGLTVETKITTLLSFTQTYELYKRVVSWVFFGTNASITYHLVQDINDGTSTNILSGESVKLKFAEFAAALDAFKQEVKDTYGDYEENSEFIRVTLDHNSKVLYGVQRNGNFYFGCGCPQQVKDYINEKIAELSLDEYEAIVAFLDNIEFGEKTLPQLLNEKVDKEEGKSLINKDFADRITYEDSPEFKEVKLDENNKILEATTKNGTKILPLGYNINGTVVKTIKHPEFLAVWLIDNKLLLAFDNKGNVYFGCGIPKQIELYIKSKISWMAEILDGFEGINLKDYLDLTFGFYESNPEYLKIYLDENNKIVKAVKKNGIVLLGVGYEINNIVTTVVENIEFVRLYLDASKHIIFGLKKDGDVVFGCGIPKQIQTYIKHMLEPIINVIGTYVTNYEYIEAKLDSTGKLLSGITPDGMGFEKVGFCTPLLLLGNHTLNSVDDIEERLEIILDDNDRIISYREKDGTKIENVGIKTPHLKLTGNGINELGEALKAGGYGEVNDLSDESFIEIPIPRTCAIINIGLDSQAEEKGLDIPTFIQYWDKNGNYFKKPILLNAQGSSSMRYTWKNQAFDLADSSKIKFGNWVPQDSFHIKKYYIDVFRGQNNVAYWLAEQIYQTRSYGNVRPWDYLNQNNSWQEGLGSFKKDFNTGALGHPDGFPVKLFFNGVCYGVYALNLKKHRDNYYAKKDNPKNIILDGNINPDDFFKGTINWTAFEIRNPKNLVYAEAHNGSYKYDADVAQDNIAGNNDDSSTYDTWVEGTSYHVNKIVVHNGHKYINTIAGNTAEPIYHAKNNSDTEPDFKNKTGCGWINCTNTIKVKNYIIDFANHSVDIHDNPSKALYNTYIMSNFVMDYCIIGEILYHHDGFHRNWIWCTWDGVLWAPTVYDLDSIFGMYWDGTMLIDSHPSYAASGLHSISDVNSTWMGNNEYNASKYFHKDGNGPGIFWDDIKLRYKELRDKGIISVDNIVSLLNKWLDNVGYDNLKEDIESIVVSHYVGGGDALVPNTPSYRDGEKEYEFVPETGGFYNSVMRIKNWLTARIASVDTYYEYSNN